MIIWSMNCRSNGLSSSKEPIVWVLDWLSLSSAPSSVPCSLFSCSLSPDPPPTQDEASTRLAKSSNARINPKRLYFSKTNPFLERVEPFRSELYRSDLQPEHLKNRKRGSSWRVKHDRLKAAERGRRCSASAP